MQDGVEETLKKSNRVRVRERTQAHKAGAFMKRSRFVSLYYYGTFL